MPGTLNPSVLLHSQPCCSKLRTKSQARKMKAAYSFRPTRSIVARTLAALGLTAFASFAADNRGLFNVLDFGAKGTGTNDDTAAIQRAVDDCAANGGGQVILPGGKIFLTGAVTLRSGMDFSSGARRGFERQRALAGLRRGGCAALCKGCDWSFHFWRRCDRWE